jgi:hypothetical protein
MYVYMTTCQKYEKIHSEAELRTITVFVVFSNPVRGPAKDKNKSSNIIENTSCMRLAVSFECVVV